MDSSGRALLDFAKLAEALTAARSVAEANAAVADFSPEKLDAAASALVGTLTASTLKRLAADEGVAAQLRAVLDSVSDCYYAVDRDWTIVEFSRSAAEYFRLARDQVIGRNLWELFPSGRGQAYEDVCRAAMDRGERARLEAPSAFQPGHVVEMHTAPMENGISVAITDITERRKAESEARKQARELQAVLDAAPAAIWITRDADGAVLTGNQFARDLLRVTDVDPQKPVFGTEELLTHFTVLDNTGAPIPFDDLSIRRAARGEAVLGIEDLVRFNDGSEIVLAGNAVPLRDQAGHVRGAVAAYTDVTHMKEVERSLIDLTRSLEVKIAEAVAAREDALVRLHEAQKTEALGQISGGVAHDFNNLLSPIIGSLDLLSKRGIADARNQRLIDGASEAAQRAKTLVQRMLAFARRQPLERIAVDVGTLIVNLKTLLESSVGGQVRVTVQLEPGLAPAYADQNQLELALLNLAINARDAMPEGGALTIAARQEVIDDVTWIKLEVSDTGIGMDKATLKKAIEPFFSTKGVGKGTGLGLSMVHGLAAQLGGRLELSSSQGLGTTAALFLPRANIPPSDETAGDRPAAFATSARALLVDDEPLVRAVTAAMLEDLGYQVVEAATADEALGLIDSGGQFDWLVTDHMMPGLSGADLARAVQQMRPEMKLIIISGYADVDAIAPDLPRLSKPFTRDELALELGRANER